MDSSLLTCVICGIVGECKEILEHYETHKISRNYSECDYVEEENIKTQDDETSSNPSAQRWCESSIKLLLSVYASKLSWIKSNKKPTKIVWGKISEEMGSYGHEFSGAQCDLKFRNLKKTYKRIKENNKNGDRGVIKWPYFSDFEYIFGIDQDISNNCTIPNNSGVIMNHSEETPLTEDSASSVDEVPSISKVNGKRKRKTHDEDNTQSILKKFVEGVEKRHKEKMSLLRELISAIKEK